MKRLLLLLLPFSAVAQNRPDIRFVNEKQAQLLTMPNAYGRPVVGEVSAGSEATVVSRLTNGWCYVRINGVPGWLYRKTLVTTLDSVKATSAEWGTIKKYPHYASVMIIGENPPVALTPKALAAIKKHARLRPLHQ